MWTNLEKELPMVKHNTEGTPFGGSSFCVYPSSFGYCTYPHCNCVHYKHLKEYGCSRSGGVSGEGWWPQTNFGKNEPHFHGTSKSHEIKFKCLFALKAFIWRKKRPGSSKLSPTCNCYLYTHIYIYKFCENKNLKHGLIMNEQLKRLLYKVYTELLNQITEILFLIW